MLNGVSSYGTQWQTMQTAQQRLSSADTNEDSKVDIDEYLAVEEADEKSQELFSKIDTDESGTLSESEISDYDTMIQENMDKMMSEAASVIAKLQASNTSEYTTKIETTRTESDETAVDMAPIGGRPMRPPRPMGPPPSDDTESSESNSLTIDSLSTEDDDEITTEELLEEYLEALEEAQEEESSEEASETTTEAQV